MDPQSVLTADVGGTHIRLAVVTTFGTAPWKLSHRVELAGPFPDFPTVLRAYFDRSALEDIPDGVVIAAAGPVSAGRVRLTNRSLEISEPDLVHFGFERGHLINDFAALAFAADVLGPEDLRSIGPPIEGMAGAPVSVLGAGTGFGVSCLVREGRHAIALSTEGGHINFAPTDDRQIAVSDALRQRHGRVSVERILSGAGLEALHTTLATLEGREQLAMSAETISAAALGGDAVCRETLTLFCSIYGAVAGDIALAHGARGGVLIGGGIASSIGKFLAESPFRDQFNAKGRLSAYVEAIPTRLIINTDATLMGAARAGLEAWQRP